MKTKVRHLNLDIKSFEQDGSFTGYGSVFGVKDSYGDVVVKGAFVNSLLNKMPKLLWQHRSDTPIGVFTSAYEDEHGLKIEGQLALDTTMGKDAHALMKMGAIDGLSIGYFLKKFEINKDEKTLYVKDVDLLEVSLVTFPANEEAQVESVKNDFYAIPINKTVADMQLKLDAMEARLATMETTSKNTEGSVAEEEAEAKSQAYDANGAVDGAIEVALSKLLATIGD